MVLLGIIGCSGSTAGQSDEKYQAQKPRHLRVLQVQKSWRWTLYRTGGVLKGERTYRHIYFRACDRMSLQHIMMPQYCLPEFQRHCPLVSQTLCRYPISRCSEYPRYSMNLAVLEAKGTWRLSLSERKNDRN